MTLLTNKTTGDEVLPAEWNEVATASNKVTDQTLIAADISDFDTEVSNNSSVAANTSKVGVTTEISNIVEDTTPQLGGNLDLNDKALTRIETAGENLVSGDLCYLNTDGKYWKADASVEATSSTDLLLSNTTIVADATGEFIEYGEFTTTSLTAGSVYYMGETGGTITSTAPTTSLSIVRVIGYAKSTTVLVFKPDTTYIEVA